MSDLPSSQTTATFIFLPDPECKFKTVLRFISFFFCLLLICKFMSIDSFNYVVQFFFIPGINFSNSDDGSEAVLVGNFLNLFEVINL